MDKKSRAKTMIYLVRHGETDWNIEHRMQGTTDIPLNKTGKSQAREIARHLKTIHIDLIYSSPLSRARQTAHIIKSHHQKAQFIIRRELLERDFGDFEGKTHEQFDAYHPAMTWKTSWWFPDFRPPAGESLQDVYTRVDDFLKEVLAKNSGKSLVFVAHGVTIRMIIGAFLGLPIVHAGAFDTKNASVTLLEHSPVHGPSIHLTNYQAEEL